MITLHRTLTLHGFSLLVAAIMILIPAQPSRAESGRSMLLGQLEPGDYHNGKVRVVKLAQAVSATVPLDEQQAPEIVSTAVSLAEKCEDIDIIIRNAIAALGKDPSEELVLKILDAALRAAPEECRQSIVNTFLDSAPRFASAITDAAANFGNGIGSGGLDGPVFGPTGRPVPAPFVFPPSSVGGGIAPGEVSPVN